MDEEPRDNGPGAGGVLDVAAVRAFHDRLDAPLTAGDGADVEALVEELRVLDELRNAITARQARAVVAVHDAQAARDVPRGIDPADTTRVVGSQVGFARRCTPHQGAAFVHLAHALVGHMPHTLAALAAGVISEWDATRIVRETTGLTGDQQSGVDAGIRDHLGTAASTRLAALAKEQAMLVAAEAVAARRRAAHARRGVSLRPAGDTMAYLTALLPVKDALACMTALEDAVTTAREAAADAGADPGSVHRGQVMADTLVERVTGRAKAHDVFGVTVNLLMPLDTLLGDTPAHVPGYGPVPADLVREWVATGDPTGPRLRRLFTHPGTGDIIGMESRARRYPGLLARLILFRDQTCRTPWCSAPVRHTDHVTRHTDGGATSERNGQGLCARCNYAKEHPDYQVTGHAGHTSTTIGGLTAASRPPAPPGMPPPTDSHPEHTLMTIIWDHNLSQRDQQIRHQQDKQDREKRRPEPGSDTNTDTDHQPGTDPTPDDWASDDWETDDENDDG
ncbi:HNH endonuclease [Flexivirga oryzae]|uniref:HNH nuclease domain-containing protein n=1 Tax=Flexivirga oryzae TaxID=1794944 RepID=A0A839NCY5_9MICO|nr:HNH endonuclease signature motif containing protein [Flexivirga oryzae]MBB2894183.1 hypothetical protein [Flexivirga oryzae]